MYGILIRSYPICLNVRHYRTLLLTEVFQRRSKVYLFTSIICTQTQIGIFLFIGCSYQYYTRKGHQVQIWTSWIEVQCNSDHGKYIVMQLFGRTIIHRRRKRLCCVYKNLKILCCTQMMNNFSWKIRSTTPKKIVKYFFLALSICTLNYPIKRQILARWCPFAFWNFVQIRSARLLSHY